MRPSSAQLALRGSGRADRQRPVAPPAPRQLRQGLQCRLGAAEAAQQLAEGDGPDILAADQPQPVQPFVVGEARR